MKIENGFCTLGDATAISPLVSNDFMEFGEESGLRILIPTKTILRIYSVMQHEVESRGSNFDKWCSEVMDKQSTKEEKSRIHIKDL